MAGKGLLGIHFTVAMDPEALHPGRAPTLPGKVKATSTWLFCFISSAGES